MTITNYLNLSHNNKLTLIANLQAMRDSVRKESNKRKERKTRKSAKHKPVFFNSEIEKLFYSMSKEAQDFISGSKG